MVQGEGDRYVDGKVPVFPGPIRCPTTLISTFSAFLGRNLCGRYRIEHSLLRLVVVGFGQFRTPSHFELLFRWTLCVIEEH